MLYKRSGALFSEAETVIPGGVNSPVRAFKAVGGTPIFIKKALASGHSTLTKESAHSSTDTTEDTVQQSFNCIYQHHSVSSIVLGSITPAHIKSNSEKAIKSFSLYHQ